MRALALSLLLSLLPVAGSVAESPCTCEENRAAMGWCDAHSLGHVAGVEIRSEDLFEALDAHGHDIDPKWITCERCREARRTDGFCDEHGMGFVDGLAWLSTLTYEIARGERREAAQLSCPFCREHAASHGWCDACGKGRVGEIEIVDREAFERLIRARAILLEAVDTVEICELCAAAMVAGGRCPICRVSYRDGEPVEDPAPAKGRRSRGP